MHFVENLFFNLEDLGLILLHIEKKHYFLLIKIYMDFAKLCETSMIQ